MTDAQPDYWNMTDETLAAAWRTVSAMNDLTGYTDPAVTEHVMFVEDAILQRIGAPDDASGDDPAWQDRIRAYGEQVPA